MQPLLATFEAVPQKENNVSDWWECGYSYIIGNVKNYVNLCFFVLPSGGGGGGGGYNRF